MHYHFAKLYLDSYVLRGLPENGPIIPDHFLETASAAVAAATSIIDLLLEDRELQMALARVPHYFHGMIAFACMFLLKVATKHSDQLFVDIARFRMLIAGLALRLKVTEVGKEHLMHRMAEGLEKMAEMLGEKSRQKYQTQHDASLAQHHTTYSGDGASNASLRGTNSQHGLQEFDQLDSNTFDFDPALLGVPASLAFFDLEGTNLGASDSMYSFVT